MAKPCKHRAHRHTQRHTCSSVRNSYNKYPCYAHSKINKLLLILLSPLIVTICVWKLRYIHTQLWPYLISLRPRDTQTEQEHSQLKEPLEHHLKCSRWCKYATAAELKVRRQLNLTSTTIHCHAQRRSLRLTHSSYSEFDILHRFFAIC